MEPIGHRLNQGMAPIKLEAPGRILQWYDRHRRILLALAVLAYCAGFSGRWQPEPDSALYLELGRNLASGRGYVYQEIGNTLAYPGLPWLWAGIDRLVGADQLQWHNLAMLLMGLGVIGLVYRLFGLFAGRAMGVVMACMTAMTYGVYRYAFELRNDLPFMLGVMALLAGLEGMRQRREKHHPSPDIPLPVDQFQSLPAVDWLLMICGLIWLILMRPHMWVVLAAILGASGINVWRSWRRTKRFRWTLLLPAVLAIGAITLFLLMDPRQENRHSTGLTYEMELIPTSWSQLIWRLKHMGTQLILLLEGETPKGALSIELGPGLDTLGSLVVMAGGLMLMRRRPLWGLLVAGTLLLMLIHEPLSRYFLPILPLLAYGWWMLAEKSARWAGGRVSRRAGEMVFLSLLTIWILPNFLRTMNLMGAQRGVHVIGGDYYAKFAAIERMAPRVEISSDPGSLIMVPDKMGRITTFLSHRNAQDSSEIRPLAAVLKWRRLYVLFPVDEVGEAKLSATPLVLGPELATEVDRENGKRLVLREVMLPGAKDLGGPSSMEAAGLDGPSPTGAAGPGEQSRGGDATDGGQP